MSRRRRPPPSAPHRGRRNSQTSGPLETPDESSSKSRSGSGKLTHRIEAALRGARQAGALRSGLQQAGPGRGAGHRTATAARSDGCTWAVSMSTRKWSSGGRPGCTEPMRKIKRCTGWRSRPRPPSAACGDCRKRSVARLGAGGRGLAPLPRPRRPVRRRLRPPPQLQPASSGFACAGKRYCREMASCEEAKFYLAQCGLTTIDGHRDGVPCETLCR